MAALREFGKFGPRLTFNANEGNLTFTTIETVEGIIQGPVFANPLHRQGATASGFTPMPLTGVYVKLSNDMEVTACAAGDTNAIGITVDIPQWKGQQPTANATWGNYTPRIVTVELFCQKVGMVNLEPSNLAIVAGNPIKFGASTAQRFDLSGTVATPVATDKIALQSASAGSGAYTIGGQIAVMFGVY
jgi:hypothetical protein